jgi:hypothetical protein
MKKVKVSMEIVLRVEDEDDDTIMDALVLHLEDAVQDRTLEYTVVDDEESDEENE